MRRNRDRSTKRFIIFIFVIISISLLIIPESITNNIKVTVASPLAPVQKIISQTSNFFKNGFKKLAVSAKAVEERNDLEKEVFLLKNKIIKQQDIINVFKKKLEIVSEYKKNIDDNEKPIVADIIGYDVSNFRKSIIIDVGKKQGVSVGDVVVFGNALVGRISAIGNSSGRVMLITDPASNVPSRFLKSRTRGIVQGTANGKCMMKYVPRQIKVDKPAKVISSGVGGVFPKSLYIGNVIAVKQKSASLFKDIKIIPRIDISKIEHVLVIKRRRSD
ncbi:MAG: rod shape-determining protein MreC [Candidatus Scalindua sp.]